MKCTKKHFIGSVKCNVQHYVSLLTNCGSLIQSMNNFNIEEVDSYVISRKKKSFFVRIALVELTRCAERNRLNY